jgi:AcrR family transcriptional regulator
MTRQVSPLRSDGVDARVARSRAAVIRTATDLLVEGGPSAVTIDAIVARSGVAKSTIYRHWPSRDDVLLAVMEACAPNLPPPDPDTDVESALRTLVHTAAGFLRDPDWARVVPALLLLKTHEHGIADLEQRLERRQEEVFQQVLGRGVADGSLRADLDIPEAIAQLIGPLFFAFLTGGVAIDDGFVDRTVDRFLATHRR